MEKVALKEREQGMPSKAEENYEPIRATSGYFDLMATLVQMYNLPDEDSVRQAAPAAYSSVKFAASLLPKTRNQEIALIILVGAVDNQRLLDTIVKQQEILDMLTMAVLPQNKETAPAKAQVARSDGGTCPIYSIKEKA